MKADLAGQARLAFVASIAVVAIMIAAPSVALAASSIQTGQADVGHRASNSVDGRIKDLHDQLKITPGQEAQWKTVAQVMLDNASDVDRAIKSRVQKTGSMNAVDDLRSYQAIVDIHAEGLKKLAAVFAPLYSSMSETQQKNADAVFGQRTDASRLKKHA